VDLDALLLLGLAVAARGHTQRAAAILDRVARERPHGTHPCSELPRALPRFSRNQIGAQYQACLRLAPEDLRLRLAFASFLQDGHEVEAAIDLLLAGLPLHRHSGTLRHAIGVALAEQGRHAEAIRHFREAVAEIPSQAASWANLGMLLKIEGAFDRSLEAYDRAVQETPHDAQIRVNRAVALLQAGRWDEAWPEYEWRLRLKGAMSLPLDLMLPSVAPPFSLVDRTVLLTHEEGFGDTLQFMRYVPLLAELGARVVAWVPAPLVRLARTVPGIAEVLTGDIAPPPFDFHCPFVSLPRVFGTTVRTVPRGNYLAVPAASAAAWSERLPPDGLLVGLVWAGQARPWLPGFSTVDRRRSAGLAAFAPLATVPGVRFVSLQMGPARAQLQEAPDAMAICDPMDGVQDFADTAAIVARLDLVISVDTAVVHLAGGMGKPVFMLDRYDNCWRWLSGRADSPWYPSLTIFRQQTMGDWQPPVARATAALQSMAAWRGVGA
jgi:tetratricopeptide (TPR) repeat protein